MVEDKDVDPFEYFSGAKPSTQPRQRLEDLSSKQGIIARALIAKGIVIWGDIPQYIIEELDRAGYKIKKKKKFSCKK